MTNNAQSQPPAIQPTPTQTNIARMRSVLDNVSIKKQFENALGKESAPFIASVMEIYSSDSKLIACNPDLVVKEALKAAILKLPVIKALGHAYIVPYNKNVKKDDGTWGKVAIPTFIIGYKGLIQLAIRSGQYETINADVVYKGELQLVDKISGEIAFKGNRTSDDIEGYFAYFKLLNGFSKTLYMSKDNLEAHAKKYSKTWGLKDGVWETNRDEMALKTVLRNLLTKWGLLSIEMISVVAQDEDFNEDEEHKNEPGGNGKSLIATDVQYEDVNATPKEAEVKEEDPGY